MKQPRKRKKTRFRKVTIKLTARQKKSLDNFCRSRRTTPNKLIKRSIRPFLENYHGIDIPSDPVKAKQLELFILEN